MFPFPKQNTSFKKYIYIQRLMSPRKRKLQVFKLYLKKQNTTELIKEITNSNIPAQES